MSGSAAEHENANKNQENEKNESEATKRSDMGAKLVKEFLNLCKYLRVLKVWRAGHPNCYENFKYMQIVEKSFKSLEGWPSSKLKQLFSLFANILNIFKMQIFTCSQSLEGWASQLLREF